MTSKLWGAAAVVLLLLAGLAFVPVGGGAVTALPEPGSRRNTMDLSPFSAEPPGRPLALLFLHHSVGGQLLADEGPPVGHHSIYATHPNGGGLRGLLARSGYDVHEASYGSRFGERTDLFDWLPKMRDHLDRIVRIAHQDEMLPGAAHNQIVVFKSCFPNSRFLGEGEPPGDPQGPELTLSNAKATMRALLPVLGRRPDVLFVYVTAPPQAPRVAPVPAWRWVAKKVLGRSHDVAALRRSGALARRFNAWLQAPDGWLAGYAHRNVVVFDYWEILTGGGRSNLLTYTNGQGYDAHPSAEGNRRAAGAFVELLNRAVRRAGLVEQTHDGPREMEERVGQTSPTPLATERRSP